MPQDIANKTLSDITVHMKYAKYLPEKERREVWSELVDRNKAMHVKKFPELEEEINAAYEYVYDKKVLPSMRSMQFGGKPVEVAPNRIFNCAYLPIDDWRSFHEVMFLLLGGTGVGGVGTTLGDPVGRFLSTKDPDGYAKVEINIV